MTDISVSDYPKNKFQTIASTSQFEKVTVQSIEELWAVISNQMIKYHHSHMRFDQICDHKHDIYLYGKLSNKLLAQAGQLLFFKHGFRSDRSEKVYITFP